MFVTFTSLQCNLQWRVEIGIRDGWGGLETGTCMKFKMPFVWMWETYSDMHLEMDESVVYSSQTDMDLEID